MAKAPASSPAADGDADPSMDDILASIRRILDEDQGVTAPSGDVLVLDSSMMVDEAAPDIGEHASLQSPVADTPALVVPAENGHTKPVTNDSPSTPPVARDPAPPLVAPEAAAAAASSVGALMRTLAAERTAGVGRSGLTIEDLVREEVRPLLKAWLDAHLPPIVERLVRSEIERVVGGQTS